MYGIADEYKIQYIWVPLNCFVRLYCSLFIYIFVAAYDTNWYKGLISTFLWCCCY